MGAGLGVFIEGLANPDAAGSYLTPDDMVNFTTSTHNSIQEIADVFDAMDGATRGAVTVSTDIGVQGERIGESLRQITHHLIETLIPHSMAWLEGYIVSHWIVPIRHRLNADETRIGILEGFRRSTDFWRYHYVDPNIKDWRAFHEWFLGWPQGVLFRWHDYFMHPAHFGEWAAAPVAGPLVSWLARSTSKNTRDNLASIMVNAWDEEPDKIWLSVQHWLVAKG